MRKPFISALLVLTALLIVTSFDASVMAQPQAQSGQQILVSKLLAEVQLALAKVQGELKDEGIPTLESVTLDLTAEATRDANGKSKPLHS